MICDTVEAIVMKVRNDLAGLPKNGMRDSPPREWTESETDRMFRIIFYGDYTFRGKTLNLERLNRYVALESCGKWLKRNCGIISAVTFLKPGSEHGGAGVILDMNAFISIEGAANEVIGAMCALADNTIATTLDGIDGTIETRCMRLSFCVNRIWSE